MWYSKFDFKVLITYPFLLLGQLLVILYLGPLQEAHTTARL